MVRSLLPLAADLTMAGRGRRLPQPRHGRYVVRKEFCRARACVGVSEQELQERLRELAEHEASVIAMAPRDQPRMHNRSVAEVEIRTAPRAPA